MSNFDLDKIVPLPTGAPLIIVVLGVWLIVKFWSDANRVKRDYRHGGKMTEVQLHNLFSGNSCLMVIFGIGLLAAILWGAR